MRIILHIIFTFLFLVISFNYSYSFESKYKINSQIKNTAFLLENHINKLNNKIYIFKNKLHIKNDKQINSWLSDIKKLKDWLKLIENDKISNLKANILIKTIINKLKTINSQIRSYFKTKLSENKIKINKFILKYYRKIKILNEKLSNFILNKAKKLIKKEKLNNKEKKLIHHLNNLSEYNKNLINFNKKNFDTLYDLKLYLIQNLKWIIQELKIIKKLGAN